MSVAQNTSYADDDNYRERGNGWGHHEHHRHYYQPQGGYYQQQYPAPYYHIRNHLSMAIAYACPGNSRHHCSSYYL